MQSFIVHYFGFINNLQTDSLVIGASYDHTILGS